MFCKNCGTENISTSRFCKECGAPLEPVPESNQGYQHTQVLPDQPVYVQSEYLPSEAYKPISMWGYFGYELLFSLPIVGFICLIIFSVSSRNKNLKNFAKSYFCVYIVAILAAVVIAVLAMGGIISLDLLDL